MTRANAKNARPAARIPTAADLMQRKLTTFAPDAPIEDAIRQLLKTGFAAAPVVDATGRLLGLLSEHDCIRVLTAAIADGWPTGQVCDHMTRVLETVRPEDDVLVLAAHFTRGTHRRLLVADAGRLVGLIARRDLLRGLAALERGDDRAKHATTYEILEERHRALD